MVTLFHFMVVNNWYITTDMYTDVTGMVAVPVIYFTVFWVTATLILMNVVLSMVLEIYSCVESEVQRKMEKTELIKNLKFIVESIENE